jgi:hypothetical protein
MNEKVQSTPEDQSIEISLEIVSTLSPYAEAAVGYYKEALESRNSGSKLEDYLRSLSYMQSADSTLDGPAHQ